ncbi:PTS sugar transporter subunit IIA [Caviibacter abscessus]|uniref:PTS sugar transporter subunit IIA n=1 Tax=Caviibacter abscessus TaxID=1766719 RepID=UPI0008333004|nr:PTS sugar transporter subunit IIA [Caviibacter abscessus]
MLRDIIEKKYYSFYESAKDWEDAIIKSCESLEKNGAVSSEYSKELIKCVKEYGPYIVIEPGIAMPHSTQQGANVFKTEIAFTKFEKAVNFDDENEATLFFTLASKDPEIHIENIQKLMEVLVNDKLKEELFTVKNIEDLKKLFEKYNI